MSLSINLTGRRALVTGVSSGIGLGVAKLLAQAGCHVAGCALDDAESDGARRFSAVVEAAGGQAFYQRVDLTDPRALAHWVMAAEATLGGIDLVVSNAGTNAFHGVTDCTEAEWAACMNINLAAHWRLAQAVEKYLEQGVDPLMIVITSNHAFATIPGCFPYNVAKAGLAALVQSLAIEWGPRIRAVGIAPGFIETPVNKAWFNGFPDPAAERSRTEGIHPVGRLGTPDEIGALCAFLAGPWGGFISGTTLLVDGGRVALMQD